MSTPVLILGESGTGKSASFRNLDPKETLLIQALEKPLPFPDAAKKGWKRWDEAKKEGNIFVTDDSDVIVQLMRKTSRRLILIDDFQYVMANEFMRRSHEKGYDKFTEIGRHAWDIVNAATALPPGKNVFILSHTQQSEDGTNKTKIKTIGKMLDEKITVEGMFSIVMRTTVRDGEYFFSTRNNGSDTVKTPMGMFEDELIANDLKLVDEAIVKYGW